MKAIGKQLALAVLAGVVGLGTVTAQPPAGEPPAPPPPGVPMIPSGPATPPAIPSAPLASPPPGVATPVSGPSGRRHPLRRLRQRVRSHFHPSGA